MTQAGQSTDATTCPPTGRRLALRLELGRVRMPADRAGDLPAGTVLELEADVSDEVLLCCCGEPFAVGTPVKLDGRLGIELREILR